MIKKKDATNFYNLDTVWLNILTTVIGEGLGNSNLVSLVELSIIFICLYHWGFSGK